MSIGDVQRAFEKGMSGRGSCKTAMMDFEDGGRTVRLSFHVVGGAGAAYLSEAIPSDMCPMQHARHMAEEFLAGRVAQVTSSGTRTLQTQLPTQTQQALPVSAMLFSPQGGGMMAPVQMPVQVQRIEMPAPPSRAAAEGLGTAPPAEHDQLDWLIRNNDLAGSIALICQWIDADAGAIRQVWASDHPGQALEYEQVRREINDLAYGLIEATQASCPLLWASVGVDVPRTGDDAADIRAAAGLINDCIDATSEFLGRVRQVRLGAKSAVRQASSVEAALEAYDQIQWPAA